MTNGSVNKANREGDTSLFPLCMGKNTYKHKHKLDLGSISSSLRYGLSTPYGLTIRNSAGLFHHVIIYTGDLHLILPALIWSTLDAECLIMN